MSDTILSYGQNIIDDLILSGEHALKYAANPAHGYTSVPHKAVFFALLSTTIAAVTMSLDDILTVAGITNGDTQMLIFSLGLSIVLMAFTATLIMKLLANYPWISWVGLIVLFYVAGEMMYRGCLRYFNGRRANAWFGGRHGHV